MALSVFLMAVAVGVAGMVAIGLPWQLALAIKVAAGIATYALSTLRLLAPILREDVLPMLPRRRPLLQVGFDEQSSFSGDA